MCRCLGFHECVSVCVSMWIRFNTHLVANYIWCSNNTVLFICLICLPQICVYTFVDVSLRVRHSNRLNSLVCLFLYLTTAVWMCVCMKINVLGITIDSIFRCHFEVGNGKWFVIEFYLWFNCFQCFYILHLLQ